MLRKLDNSVEHCDFKFHATKKGEFEGYASVFGGVDSYGDTVVKGAFDKTIESGLLPKMFVNHDSFQVPVGDWVDIKEDDTGLLVVGVIDMNHKDGMTVHSALKRKAMDGMSIGYKIFAGGSEENDTGGLNLSSVDVKEISVVNFPADGAARISGVKNDIVIIESLKDAERYLRELGLSKSLATAYVSQVRDICKGDPSDIVDQITDLEREAGEKATSNIVKLIRSM